MAVYRTDFPEPSDAELISTVLAGETNAYVSLVRRHLPSIRAFVAMKLPVAHLVDEIAHESFVYAYQNLVDLVSPESFRAWLRGIAWNLVRKELLRYAREQTNLSKLEQSQLAELADAGEPLGSSDEAIFLEECLATLPQTARTIVMERYRRGLSNEELAAAMGRTGEWVRVTLFRIRAQLRECITMKMELVCQ